MLRALILFAALPALAGCAQWADYAYDYDPYGGPHGHYVGPLEGGPGRTSLGCAPVAFTGPYDAGYRGAYMAGPVCAPAADGAGVPAAAQAR